MAPLLLVLVFAQVPPLPAADSASAPTPTEDAAIAALDVATRVKLFEHDALRMAKDDVATPKGGNSSSILGAVLGVVLLLPSLTFISYRVVNAAGMVLPQQQVSQTAAGLGQTHQAQQLMSTWPNLVRVAIPATAVIIPLVATAGSALALGGVGQAAETFQATPPLGLPQTRQSGLYAALGIGVLCALVTAAMAWFVVTPVMNVVLAQREKNLTQEVVLAHNLALAARLQLDPATLPGVYFPR